MRLVERWFPRTGRCVVEGMRLALLNAMLMGLGGVAVFLLFEAALMLRKIGVPIPLPVWLVMVILIIPYYVLMFQYGKTFGALSTCKNAVAGFIVGLLGQVPSILSLAVTISRELYRYIHPEIWRVLFFIITMVIIVAPIMVGLGSLDRHDRRDTKK